VVFLGVHLQFAPLIKKLTEKVELVDICKCVRKLSPDEILSHKQHKGRCNDCSWLL